jgi:hypothetical protein
MLVFLLEELSGQMRTHDHFVRLELLENEPDDAQFQAWNGCSCRADWVKTGAVVHDVGINVMPGALPEELPGRDPTPTSNNHRP